MSSVFKENAHIFNTLVYRVICLNDAKVSKTKTQME